MTEIDSKPPKDVLLRRRVLIQNELGLHARAAAKLVSVASGFNSEVYIEKDGFKVNGKSIIGILTLAAVRGSEIELQARGEDAEEVLEDMVALVKNKFDEVR